MKINKGDFIELDFVARIKESNQVFDLTKEDIAKKEGIYNKSFKYEPIIICVGKGFVIRGLDKELEGKEVDKEYKIEVKSEDAFGKKDAKLLKIVNSNIFIKKEINPMPGLQVNIDNRIGVIRSVSGGRVIVDFNHPLAGRDLVYEVKINRKVEDVKEKIEAFLKAELGLNEKMCEISIKEKEAEIKCKVEIPDKIKEDFIKEIEECIKGVKIKFLKIDKTE
jgi:FKBP-type peptidyl-prolyl cis-trans isomerase 2